ncbi:WD-40 repeat protein [Reticulomyxa filosa]|uniref:WD-40 repeat protein n=1 Tax=Reticulomyxa filosa TaxID=46433 RepID=X6M0Z0_RETFI|nr:WD-40 repeat protein [Reticulomyxa filosa]|eukprot:ETO07534.1 WD-40 repeat protein [Reticulomyxa filosa]
MSFVCLFSFNDKQMLKNLSIIFFYYFTQTTAIFMLDTFLSSSKLLKTFQGHTDWVWSIDYLTSDIDEFICSGSHDKTVRVWDVNENKQIRSFNGHSDNVYHAKFSPYHYYNNHRSVICSSSRDKTIRFWDIKDNLQLQVFNGHTDGICGITFSSFNGGRYLFSGSWDKTIHLWDVETSKALHIFNGHKAVIWCVDISPLQGNNHNRNDNNGKSNSAGVIGGNGYTICSGSFDKTIRIWDIETNKQLIVFDKHSDWIRSVKYGSNELENIGACAILSGSSDKSIRLWIFGLKELHIIKGNKEHGGILCLKFLQSKKDKKRNSDINLCYGSVSGSICVWG